MNDYTSNIIIIPLSKHRFTIVDKEDSDLAFMEWSCDRYVYRKNPNKPPTMLYLHRVILERELGGILVNDEYCDHKNSNPLDNRRENLRIATRNDNARNAKKSKANTSGYKGVSRFRDRWQASIRVNGKKFYLGHFKTPEEAHEAYCIAAKKYFGEFARFE